MTTAMPESKQIITRGQDPVTGKLHEETLPADCFGDVAVHLSWDCERWTITHIPTGYLIATLPDYDGACLVAEELSKAADWTFTDGTHVPGATRVEATIVLRRFKKLYPDLQAVFQ